MHLVALTEWRAPLWFGGVVSAKKSASAASGGGALHDNFGAGCRRTRPTGVRQQRTPKAASCIEDQAQQKPIGMPASAQQVPRFRATAHTRMCGNASYEMRHRYHRKSAVVQHSWPKHRRAVGAQSQVITQQSKQQHPAVQASLVGVMHSHCVEHSFNAWSGPVRAQMTSVH